MTALCISFPEGAHFGKRLAGLLGVAHGEVELHRFPDAETRVRLAADCAGQRVILICGGHDPNALALPMYFAARTARDLGASNVGLVAPYLAYMRQDTRFVPGEAISAVAYADFLSESFDWIATVDPHLHRIHSLDRIFTIPALCVASAPAIAAWISAKVEHPVIVGPDSESAQWVREVARALGVPWTVLAKTRAGDRDVAVSVPDPAILQGRNPVLVDDIASSGHTLAQAATALRNQGAPAPTCIVVHALMSEGAGPALQAAGVTRMVSTNTIAHSTNAIDVAPLLAHGIRGLLGD